MTKAVLATTKIHPGPTGLFHVVGVSEDPSFVSLLLSFPYQRHPVVDQGILHFHREGRQNILDLLLVFNLLPEFGLNDLPLDIS